LRVVVFGIGNRQVVRVNLCPGGQHPPEQK
jgi:hypothetical protein